MIDKPGIYDVPIDIYHSQKCCIGPSASSSGLRTLDRECPARFYAHSDLNPRPVLKDSKAFSFGRAAHALVLGEPDFAARFVISPFDSFKTKEAQQWRDEQTKDIVRAADMEIINDMAQAQRASDQVMNAFTHGDSEKSIIWQDAETEVWLKSRPDWLPHQPAKRFTCEYKTAQTLHPRHLSFAVFKYGYEMQAALALDGIEIVTGEKPLGMAHCVQEKDAPYLAELRLFTPAHIDFGRRQYRKAVRKFADCIHAGKWPGYTTEATYFDTPYQTEKAMENFDDDAGTESEGQPARDDFVAAF